ncbi:MAG: hypothetical protein ACK5RL_18555 [Acidimicrobiales bacterium]
MSAVVGTLVSAGAAASLGAPGLDVTPSERAGLLLDTSLAALAVAAVGAVVVGVLAVSNEYRVDRSAGDTPPQITSSLTAVPHRGRLVLAKLAAVAAVTTGVWLVAAVPGLIVSRQIIGPDLPAGWISPDRLLGSWLYFELTSGLAFGLTLLTRRGVVPLVILITNASVVSVGQLLTTVTSWGYYAPDLAGANMFLRGDQWERSLHPIVGGLIMALWAAAAVGASAGLGWLARSGGDDVAAVVAPWVHVMSAGLGATLAGAEFTGGQARTSALAVPRRRVRGAVQMALAAAVSTAVAAVSLAVAGVSVRPGLVVAVALGGWLGATATTALRSATAGISLVGGLAVVAVALGAEPVSAMDRLPLDLVDTLASPALSSGSPGAVVVPLAFWIVAGWAAAWARMGRDIGWRRPRMPPACPARPRPTLLAPAPRGYRGWSTGVVDRSGGDP